MMPEKWFNFSFGGEGNRVKHPLQVTVEDLCGINRFQIKHGMRITNWNPNAFLRSRAPDHDGEADDVLCEHLYIPTFSPRLQAALAAADVGQGDLQYLPVHVYQSTGEDVPGFAFANVISRVPALDYERSEMLELDPDEIDPLTGREKVLSVWTEALHTEPLRGHDMIRLVEFFPPVFVSERFVKIFEEGQFTGAEFEPVPVT